MTVRARRAGWAPPPFTLGLVLLLVLAGISTAVQPRFLEPAIVAANVATFLPLMLTAMGQSYVVLGGSIDLSLGAVISLVNVAVVQVAAAFGADTAGPGALLLAMAAGVGIGLLSGLANGLLIGALRLQPLVATFATAIILGGCALWVLPQAGGSLPPLYYESFAGSVLGVPVAFWLLLVVLVAVAALARTRFWIYLLAAGANRQAAFQTGLPVPRVRVLVHVLAGGLASLAALCVLGQTGAGDPLMGQTFTLASVSAVVLGGTPLTGGRGTVVGALIGGLVLGLVNNVIFFLKIPYQFQSIVQGLIVLAALTGGVLVARR